MAAAGAEAVTLINTVPGLAIDPETRRPRLGRRAAAGCRVRPSTRSPCGRCTMSTVPCPSCPIVGVGGVTGAADAVELLLAGASAVQVGTATFADPRAAGPDRRAIWTGGAESHGILAVVELIGAAHAP